MKKISWFPVLAILIALLAAGCGKSSAPTSSPVGPLQGSPQQGGPQQGGNVQIDFRADADTLQPGQCTSLHWTVQGGHGVRLDGQPVDPTGQRQVCPNATTTYRLEVDAGGRVEAREVTIQVGGGGGPVPTNKPGGGIAPTAMPTAAPTVKSGGGGGGGSVPTHTPTASPKGYVDIGIFGINVANRNDPNPNLRYVEVTFENFGTKKWSKSEDPSSSGDLEFACSRSFTVGGKISTSNYSGSVPRDQIDDPGERYLATPWYYDRTGVTALTVSCRITKGPTYDSDPSNNNYQWRWDFT